MKKVNHKKKKQKYISKNKVENNHEKVKEENHNKAEYSKNGDRKTNSHYKVLQINSSNACFNSKL